LPTLPAHVIGLVEVAANVNAKIVHKLAIELEEAIANVKRRLVDNHMVSWEEAIANVKRKLVDNHMVSQEKAIANVKRRLADNHMVALVGMGGIGKTILMKKLYCQIHADFKKSSFLENVKANDVVAVQKKLIMDLCGLKLQDPTTYLTCLKKCWTKMKVLIIIELLGEDMDGIRRSENGSRVIMAGRNWRDFESVVREDGKLEMELFNKKQTMELFSLKAFQGSVSPHDVASIANEVVDACHGLTLSLEVMGVWFSTQKTPQEWKEGSLRLKNAPPFGAGCCVIDELWRQLIISYNNLRHEEREMFLDIVCFIQMNIVQNLGVFGQGKGGSLFKEHYRYGVPHHNIHQ
jgi:hypothetical protein